jgi:hypothetical protein
MPAPAVSADLLVSGIAREGHRLLAMNTFGDLVSTDSLSYQWLLDGQALAGATGKSLLLDAAHIGKAVSVSVSYRNAAGQTQSALSPAVPEVLATPAGQGVHLAVHLSQAAVDGMGTSNGGDSGLDRIVDGMVRLQSLIEVQYNQSLRYSVTPTQVTGHFGDGSTRTRTYVKDDATATAGLATVSQWEFNKPGAFLLAYGGQMRYAYNETTASLLFQQGTIDGYTLINRALDSQYGRQSVALLGTLNATGGLDAKFQGEISSIHMAASKFLGTVTFEGKFQVAGDFSDIASSLGRSRVDGMLTGLQQTFRDGSYLSISGERDASPPRVVDGELLDDEWLNAPLPGNDLIELSLPERPGSDWTVLNAGAGQDTLILQGGGGQISVDAGADDDRVVSKAGSHQMAGGDGIDTLVLPQGRNHYLLQWSEQGQRVRLQSPTGDIDQASGFERFEFAGTTYTQAELMQTARVHAKTWKQAPMSGVNLGTAGAVTDAQGLGALKLDASARLPLSVPADALAQSRVDLGDAILVLKSIVGLVELSPYQRLAANFDEQGEVNLGDAIGILKHVVGLSGQAPVWKLLRDPTDATASATDPLQLTAGQDQDVQLIGVLTGDVDGSWAPA